MLVILGSSLPHLSCKSSRRWIGKVDDMEEGTRDLTTLRSLGYKPLGYNPHACRYCFC